MMRQQRVRAAALVVALAALGSLLLAGMFGRDATTPTSAAWTDRAFARAAVEVSGPVAPSLISAGTGFTCAVVDARSWCWGYGGDGQLGTGSTANAAEPVATVAGEMGDAGITMLDAGNARACAIADGAAYCWGQGGGSLGDFDTVTPWEAPASTVPVAVYAEPAGTGVNEYESPLYGRTATTAAAGDALGCASTADGSLACWGNQVGFARPTDGTDPRRWANAPIAAPTQTEVPLSELPSGAFVSEVTTDFNTGCLIANGDPYCWGVNQEGQVGSGTAGAPVTVPTSVVAGEMTARPVVEIDGGTFHSCALADGAAYCWGLRSSGQIGDSTEASGDAGTGSSLSPRRVALPDGVTVVDVAAGGSTSCALTDDGLAYCWGANEYGQVGSGTAPLSAMLPQPVDTSQLADGLRFTAVTVGNTHTCAVATDDEVYCWGRGGLLGSGAGQTDAGRPELPVSQTWAGAA